MCSNWIGGGLLLGRCLGVRVHSLILFPFVDNQASITSQHHHHHHHTETTTSTHHVTTTSHSHAEPTGHSHSHTASSHSRHPTTTSHSHHTSASHYGTTTTSSHHPRPTVRSGPILLPYPSLAHTANVLFRAGKLLSSGNRTGRLFRYLHRCLLRSIRYRCGNQGEFPFSLALLS